MSAWAYTGLLAVVALERLAELVVARRNAAWSLARGGRELSPGHYPVMVVLHTGLLLGCALEVWALERPFLPWLGVPALAGLVLAQGLRWWCVASLGRRWNTRIIVIPGLAPVRRGPYRWLAHPNYVAVVLEGLALPLVHTAWLTALAFTALDLLLLAWRVRCEDAALAWAAAQDQVATAEAAP